MTLAFRSFAIIPAAGRSLRMGTPKLLLPIGGQTVIERTIAAWQASGVSHVAVTVYADDLKLREVVARTSAEMVTVDEVPPDMKASALAGLKHIASKFNPQAADVWMLSPADLPTLSSPTIDRLLSEYAAEPDKILIAAHQGQRGHPTLFPWPLAAEVERLAADEGINRLKQLFPTELVECGPAALAADLDTPEDYRRLLAETGEP